MQFLAAVQDQLCRVVDDAGIAGFLDLDDFRCQFLAVYINTHNFLSLAPRRRAATKGKFNAAEFGVCAFPIWRC
jgi:hypothetical protein